MEDKEPVTKQLKVYLTESEHRAFGIYCYTHDTKMNTVMRALIRQVLSSEAETPEEAIQNARAEWQTTDTTQEVPALRKELIACVLENKDNEDWPRHMQGDVVMQWVNMTTKSERYGNKVETYPIPKEIEDAIQDEEEDADADGSDTGSNGSDR